MSAAGTAAVVEAWMLSASSMTSIVDASWSLSADDPESVDAARLRPLARLDAFAIRTAGVVARGSWGWSAPPARAAAGAAASASWTRSAAGALVGSDAATLSASVALTAIACQSASGPLPLFPPLSSLPLLRPFSP